MQAIRTQNVWLLSLAQAFHVAAALTAVSVVSLVGLSLAPSASLATIPSAMLTVGVALSTIPLSYFMKHTSRRKGFLLGAFFGILSFSFGVASIYLESYWMLCLASLLQGVWQASVLYYRFAAAESVGEDRQKSIAISFVLAGSIFAVLLAPSGSHFLNNMFMPFEYAGAFVFMLLMAVVAFVPLSFLKPLGIEEEEDQGVERPLLEIIKQPKTICAMTNTAAAWATMVLMMSATPIAMKHSGHMFEHSSMVIQWHVLGMYVPSLFSGFLISRFGSLKVLFSGAVFLAISFFAAYQGQEFLHFSLALIFLGAGWNFLFVGATTLLTETHTPAERAKVQGANEFMGFTVSALASGFAGAIISIYGWNSLLVLEVVILSIALGVTIWYATTSQHKKAVKNMEFE
ncbi:MAG: MFS transporter, partial [Sphingomonadales bacterium]|nr:MFS transporter [Sphingomonadales bacterium]